jgi:YihY family inner membrane protein
MSWANDPRWRPLRRRVRLADFALDVLDAYSRHRTGRNASLLAYMGLLTVFPLLLMATTVLGLVLEGNPDLQEAILDSFVSRIPVVGPSLVENQGQITGSWLALVIGLLGAIWGSLRAFNAMQIALDDIWEVETGRRNYFVQRLASLTFIAAIGLAQAGSVALAATVGHAGLPRTGQFLLTFGGLVLNVAIVGSIYRFLTSKPMTWRLVWRGTVFTSVVFTVLQFTATNILTRRLDGAEAVYGTFAALVVLAFWVSIHALVALIGAEINAAVQRRRHRIGPAASIEATAIMKRGTRRREPVTTGAGDG